MRIPEYTNLSFTKQHHFASDITSHSTLNDKTFKEKDVTASPYTSSPKIWRIHCERFTTLDQLKTVQNIAPFCIQATSHEQKYLKREKRPHSGTRARDDKGRLRSGYQQLYVVSLPPPPPENPLMWNNGHLPPFLWSCCQSTISYCQEAFNLKVFKQPRHFKVDIKCKAACWDGEVNDLSKRGNSYRTSSELQLPDTRMK